MSSNEEISQSEQSLSADYEGCLNSAAPLNLISALLVAHTKRSLMVII